MTQNANISVSDFFDFVKKTTNLCNVFSGLLQFLHFSLFCICAITFEQLGFRPIQHLKMTV